ncbi:MAG: hypothetical protein ACO394_00205 [Blastocatellia bacterium]|jgi:hypothetical protein
MGRAATRSLPDEETAAAIGDGIACLIATQGRAIVLLDGSPLLTRVYDHLSQCPLDWTRVIGIQLRERTGPEGLGQRLLIDWLVSRVPMAEFHGLRGAASNLAAVCANHGALLQRRPPDLALVALEEGGYPIRKRETGGLVCHQPPWIGLCLETLCQLPCCHLAGCSREIESLAPLEETVFTFPLF